MKYELELGHQFANTKLSSNKDCEVSPCERKQKRK